MNATRITATTLGIYAGLLGMAHGFFEVQQGNIATGGIMIQAIGDPCQPDAIAHACFPAMTLLPNMRLAGILALILGGLIAFWAEDFITHKYSPPILALLGVGLLLAGGGFLPPFYTLLTAGAATQISGLSPWLQKRLPARLAVLWPWVFIVYGGWTIAQIILRSALNDFLLGAGAILFPLGIVALLLSILSAFAWDSTKSSQPVT